MKTIICIIAFTILNIATSFAQCNICYGNKKITRKETCPHCQGYGSFTETVTKNCSICNGRGSTSSTCSTCRGKGIVPSREECSTCKGSGYYGSVTHQLPCKTCLGKGYLPTTKICPSCYGNGTTERQCSSCGGYGKISETHTRTCNRCGGKGSMTKEVPCPVCSSWH